MYSARHFSAVLLTIAIASCGAKDSSSSSDAAQIGSRKQSFLVDTSSELPTCNDSEKGSLGYVESEKKFYACKNNAWTVVDLSSSSNSLKEIWSFSTDDLNTIASISLESATTTAKIANVQLTRFTDGSALVNIVGIMIEVDGGSNTYRDNFSHTFYLKDSTAEQEITLKFDSYSKEQIRYKITLTDAPSLKATVDITGDFTNNSYVTVPLTKL
ncbi:MAG: hypothetical protein KA436_07635 [Oligoflexales bacterium]|nr:hypothetical protein [Oligoflexales bacterium]